MASRDVEAFAETLIRAVRDVAVRSCDQFLRPETRTPVGMRWAAVTDAAGREAIRMAIPDIVDEALFFLVNRGIDQGMLRLFFRGPTGADIDLTEDGAGELSGSYMTEWRRKYSRERFVDDFDDDVPEV